VNGPLNRRQVLRIVGAAVVAISAGSAMASTTDMNGTVTFEGGKAIPKGRLVIYLEDRAIDETPLRRLAETTIDSDGGSPAIAFTLSPPASFAPSPTLQIVARLERADGWLVARGSTQLETGSPVTVRLNTVMY
jgi:uncharacterized lipoprotein YbaY